MTDQSYTTQLSAFLPAAHTGVEPTMSSIEIAELTGKAHKNVMADIRTMIDGLKTQPINALSFEGIYRDERNREQKCYRLPKRECLILVSGYSIELRAKIIDRWMELEGARPAIDFSDPKLLLGVVGHLQAQVLEKETVIAEQGIRLKHLDRLESAKGSMCISDAAKTLGVGRDHLFQFLSSRRWTFKRPGNKNWLAYDDKRKAMLLEHDDHLYMDSLGQERVATRVLVTAKGLVKLAELLEQPLH